jgi:hypothetical protein
MQPWTSTVRCRSTRGEHETRAVPSPVVMQRRAIGRTQFAVSPLDDHFLLSIHCGGSSPATLWYCWIEGSSFDAQSTHRRRISSVLLAKWCSRRGVRLSVIVSPPDSEQADWRQMQYLMGEGSVRLSSSRAIAHREGLW